MEAHINSIDLSSLSLLLLLLVLSSILFLYGKQGKRKSRPNLPPGSMGWPFIGETFAMLKYHSPFSLGRYLEDHTHRYGKIFKSNIGGPTIVSTDAAFNRFILQNEGRLFDLSFPETVRRIFGERSLLTLSGEGHKELRSIALKFLSNDKLRTRFLPDVEHNVLQVINSWKDGLCISGTEEAIKHGAWKARNRGHKGKICQFLARNCNRASQFPWNSILEGSQVSISDCEIGRIVDLRMEEIRQGETKGDSDMLCWCLTELKLPKEKILDLLLGLLFGGFETSSVALSLTIFFLGHCPRAFQELRNEHIGIARKKTERGATNLNWEDYKQMEFTHCVVKETLRLGNIVKFLNRKAIEEVHYQGKSTINIEGYDIPRGWKVFLVISSLHLDGSIYKDPQEFNPWRWQNKSASTVDLMPFGGGQRLCPGAELTKMELAIFLHHLVLNYRWELRNNKEPTAFPNVVFQEGLPIQVFKINNN
ncbi:cholesterol 22-monohydroxylase CYP90B52-like [Carex rostrata]